MTNRETITIRANKETFKILRELAAKEHVSIAILLERITEYYMKQKFLERLNQDIQEAKDQVI